MMPFGYFTGLEAGFTSLLGLAATIFWIVMLVDVIRRDFSDNVMKVVWVLVLLFTHALGALIYYFIGRPMGRLRGGY